MNATLKVFLIGIAVLVFAIAASGVWLYTSGRAQKMAGAMDELRKAAARPGAAEVRAVPGCGVAAVLDTKNFWESSAELQQRFPVLSDLPQTLILCGLSKHVAPPRTTSVAKAYARAFTEPQSVVVVITRSRIGEKVFEAETFDAAGL